MGSNLENILIICIESANPITEINFYGKIVEHYPSYLYFFSLDHSCKGKNHWMFESKIQKWARRTDVKYKLSEGQIYFEALEINTRVYIIHDWDVQNDKKSLAQTCQRITQMLLNHNFATSKIQEIYDPNHSFDWFLYQITHDIQDAEVIKHQELRKFAKCYKTAEAKQELRDKIFEHYQINKQKEKSEVILKFLKLVVLDQKVISRHKEILIDIKKACG